MEQENLNEKHLPEEGALNNSEMSPEASAIETDGANVEMVENEAKAESQGNEAAQPVADEYVKCSRAELISKLNQLINNNPVETIVNAVEEIKSLFYKKYRADYQAARESFMSQEGAEAENFKFADENQEETFKELYAQYKQKKAVYNQQVEAEREANLKARLEIIEEIKGLVNSDAPIGKIFQDFHGLQSRWRESGEVSPTESKNVWTAYNYAVEQFYEYAKINKELRDLDLKENLKAKTELCEKAEELILEKSVVKAFRDLQVLHDKWREVGPVPNEQKEEIWERFKAATSIINKKHQEYFEGQKDQQIKNLEQKTTLCERLEEIINSEITKPKEWEEKSNDVLKIQELWRTIGYAPKKDNSKIYQRFKNDCDLFFAKKRDFYKDIKAEQKDNTQRKLELCEKAEQLKTSTDWKKATDEFIAMQQQWKEIGQTSRKQSEQLWKRFREACDFFFKAKSAHFSSIDGDQNQNLQLKQALIEKVKNFEKSDDNKDNLRRLTEIQKEWAQIGHVPLSQKDSIQKEFRDAINAQFSAMKIEASEREKANFKNKIDSWSGSQGKKGKIYSERSKIAQQIRELENEITLYENNMGFFAKSANSESLIKDINRKIDKAKERLADMYEKMRMLDDID
ncbi:MAG: DUF349 domain-containing protein [Salinivirgaceae bacterium]|nr:DUF349 domain-containing protein [Salinivirgaceae bacterium]